MLLRKSYRTHGGLPSAVLIRRPCVFTKLKVELPTLLHALYDRPSRCFPRKKYPFSVYIRLWVCGPLKVGGPEKMSGSRVCTENTTPHQSLNVRAILRLDQDGRMARHPSPRCGGTGAAIFKNPPTFRAFLDLFFFSLKTQ